MVLRMWNALPLSHGSVSRHIRNSLRWLPLWQEWCWPLTCCQAFRLVWVMGTSPGNRVRPELDSVNLRWWGISISNKLLGEAECRCRAPTWCSKDHISMKQEPFRVVTGPGKDGKCEDLPHPSGQSAKTGNDWGRGRWFVHPGRSQQTLSECTVDTRKLA